jgi:hypothetical protein
MTKKRARRPCRSVGLVLGLTIAMSVSADAQPRGLREPPAAIGGAVGFVLPVERWRALIPPRRD